MQQQRQLDVYRPEERILAKLTLTTNSASLHCFQPRVRTDHSRELRCTCVYPVVEGSPPSIATPATPDRATPPTRISIPVTGLAIVDAPAGLAPEISTHAVHSVARADDSVENRARDPRRDIATIDDRNLSAQVERGAPATFSSRSSTSVFSP